MYEHDGCVGCKYIDKKDNEQPCLNCKQNYISPENKYHADFWEPAEVKTSPGPATIESTRRAILREAEKNICGQREQDYGSPESNFAIIAELWTAYTGHEFSALDVAMMMVLLKVARIKNGGGTGDSFVDIAGYAACGGEIREANR